MVPTIFSKIHLLKIASSLTLLLVTSCAPPQQLPGKPWHHTTDGFRNPQGSPKRNSWIERSPWLFNRIKNMLFYADKPTASFSHIMPKKEVFEGLKSSLGNDTVTWLGHMTALLRINNKTILTDPWLSQYASPIRPFGPKRYTPPALNVKELPPIDFIVISHSHFDHLDLTTIKELSHQKNISVVVPLGVGKYFRGLGYREVIELDWEQSVQLNHTKFTALPVIHWSKRSLFSNNDSLWAGWAIESSNGTKVYFGGDAEYGPVYANIGKRYGGFDLTLLSIGAYLPRIVMKGAHCVPEDCIRIGHDLKGDSHLAMHWGTVKLGDNTPEEAILRFRAGGKRLNIQDNKLWVMKIGETRIIPKRNN